MARGKSFDPVEKLEQAMLLFWEYGFTGTSLEHLERQLGVRRFSLYNAFGDKNSLYLKSVSHFRENYFLKSMQPLTQAHGLQAIHQYFDFLYSDLGSRDIRGCFLMNVAMDKNVNDPALKELVATTYQSLRDGLQLAIVQARSLGELPETCDADAYTEVLYQQALGLMSRARMLPWETIPKPSFWLTPLLEQWSGKLESSAN